MNCSTLSKDSNKLFGCVNCKKCSHYIREICYHMEPIESDWFRQCVVEIEQCDGHPLLERFLRIYRAFNLDYPIGAET